MNFIGLLALSSSIAIFWITHRVLTQKPLRLRILVLGAALVLSIPALLFSLYYFHVIPEKAWFYNLRSWSGSEFLVIFLGAAGGAAATVLPRYLLILPLLGSVGIAVVPYLKPWINPLVLPSSTEKWDGAACLQSTASTCGPASTASILRWLGIDASEHEIARAAYTSNSGTEAWYLARYIRSRGLGVRFDFQRIFSPSGEFPALVGVRVSGFGHFIAVLEIAENQVTFVDPLTGKSSLPLAEFLSLYEFTGFRMVVSKG